jgi:hypothetical protein
MRTLRLIHLGGLFLLGCSANGGAAGDAIILGSGGAAPSATCSLSDGCTQCSDCLSSCRCMTGNSADCPVACGLSDPSGGAPSSGGAPPVNPPPASGGAPSSGGAPPDNPPPPSGGTGGASACTYPTGPYGTKLGQIVNPNLTWQGFREDEAQSSTISVQDYFDCDGARGINAVMLSEGAVWCGACQQEASELNSRMAGGWKQKGVRVLELIIETGSGSPATLQTASAWKDTFNATGWAVAADPDFSFASGGGNGLPLLIVVDPRTMKVVDRIEGAGDYYSLEQLAAANAK